MIHTSVKGEGRGGGHSVEHNKKSWGTRIGKFSWKAWKVIFEER
jgi:hypothetical protein